ncbi:hypothetical protein B0H10DRAFT_2194532, partial [Mycena sp. CBHHK59/15]
FDFSFVPRYPGLSWRRRRLFTGISRYIYLPHTIATNLEPATTPNLKHCLHPSIRQVCCIKGSTLR